LRDKARNIPQAGIVYGFMQFNRWPKHFSFPQSAVLPYFSGMKQLIFFFAILSCISAGAQPAWQQRVDTKIEVTLNDHTHFLNASEEFTYTNNSPDTLRFIYIHLWPNAYKNDHTPFARQLDRMGNTNFYYAKPRARGYIDSLEFRVNGQVTDHFIAESSPDIARIDLAEPLLPGHKMMVSTPFRVKIPRVFSRMGHTGQAYYISQWFPKPAVYDQKGWHPISYLDQGEFFSEYGSYDVSITLPANYVVMATGNCLDDKENEWLAKKARDTLPSDTLYTHSSPPSAPETKTLHFHEDNIHDFAWFADKRWIVRMDTVTSPGNNLLVTTYTAFLPDYKYFWLKGNDYLSETVKRYGGWVGPYRYKTIKAVLGDMKAGGGMEYPTVTVIDKTAMKNLKTVIIHEAGHNWFYGMLGSNERDHAWMDEGINTFYEQKTIRKDNDSVKNFKVGRLESMLYYELAATREDQAIEQTSDNFKKLNYGMDVYYKTAMLLRWMEKYMGDEDFEKGMKDYYDTWHFHHPYPEDFRVCMQRHSSRSLDCFFDNLFKSGKRIDFTILKARINGNNTEITVRNNSGVASPALIDERMNGEIVHSGWTEPFTGKTTISLTGTDWNSLKIDDIIPDDKSTNDVYRRNALFHHFGLEVRPFFGLNTDDKDKLFVSPALGYNNNDGFMLGLLFHDITLPENRFRFELAPMYAFNSNTLVGAGSVGYLWYPGNLFKEIMLQADAKTFDDNQTRLNLSAPLFSRFIKVAPSLSFTFNEHNPLSPVTRVLLLKGYSITNQNFSFSSDSLGKPVLVTQQKFYGLLRYSHRNNRTYNPFGYTLEGQLGADFGKLTAEGNIRIDYNTKNKALYVRGFLGKYFPVTDVQSVTSVYELNATYSGMDDYLYDGTYMNRNNPGGKFAQQIALQEGGFKVPVYNNAARSDNYMATMNLETDLPLPRYIPLRLFLDAGLMPNSNPGPTNSGPNTVLYDGGVELNLIKNIVNIYIPIIMSNDFQNYIINNFGKSKVFEKSVSFTLQFQNINWLKDPSKLLKTVVN